MTTPTRPLPPGVAHVSATAPQVLWLCVSDESSDNDLAFPSDPSEVTWAADHCPVACGVRYVRADAQPENQPPAEQKYASPGYRAGSAAGLESAERVISELTARVAALEEKAQVEAPVKSPVKAPVKAQAEPAHREPVVGMAYMERCCWWRLTADGDIEFNYGTDKDPDWKSSRGLDQDEFRSEVAKGTLVPVPWYKVEVTP